ncbi:MAG: hypothetical protein AAF467_21195 [Actinomycetota bacterium]
MALRKLNSTDAFVITDIADVPAAGTVRRARKILQSGAKELARSASYTFAAFEHQRSGAAAGINAEGDGVDDAIAAFVTELTPAVADGQLHLNPGKGLNGEHLAELTAASPAEAGAGSDELLAASVVAATTWALGGSLDGRRLAVEGAPPVAVLDAVRSGGAEIVDVAGAADKPWMIWGAEVDAILAGSKAGALTHQGAAMVKAAAIVPWGAIPVTTKAFAQLHRTDTTVVPDFVSAAGPLLGGLIPGEGDAVASEVAGQVTDVLTQAATSDDGVLLGACYAAEAFLATWLDERLFGRPLAA